MSEQKLPILSRSLCRDADFIRHVCTAHENQFGQLALGPCNDSARCLAS